MTSYDYEALLRLERERNKRLIDNGESQRDELDELRRQRDMLARRLAEEAHKRLGISYPKNQQAA